MTRGQDTTASALVILVHGLWMSGIALRYLGRCVEAHSALSALTFSYPSVSGSIGDHARALVAFARTRPVSTLHFIGHSLGGIVIMRALELADDLPPGRAVLLGTPSQGSKAAQGVARYVPFGKTMLGAALIAECIDCPPRTWSGQREIGVIAGSMSFGLGRLFARFQTDHDGTVLVEETLLPGAVDHIILPVSHTGMLMSDRVAAQAAHFLEEGRFRR